MIKKKIILKKYINLLFGLLLVSISYNLFLVPSNLAAGGVSGLAIVINKLFGIQIDSLTDVIAFGVTPAVVFYFHGVNSIIGIAILVIYVLCGLSRLAFFNVLETKRQADPNESACLKAFRGMPITFSAIITPIACFVCLFLPCEVRFWVYHIVPALMAFFFVFDLRIPKPDIGGLLFGKKK